MVDIVRTDAVLEKLGGIEQIRKENAVDEKTRTVAHNHGQLSDLPREGERPSLNLIRSLFSNDDFDQLHPADRVEKMHTDDAPARIRCGSQFTDRKSGSVRSQNRFWFHAPSEIAKDFFLDVDLFRGGFDHDLDVAHFYMSGRSNDARAAFLRF